MVVDVNSIPMLSRGCRLHATQNVLLVPEGMLELSGPSRDVLIYIDGIRNVRAIVNELLQQYQGTPEPDVRADVLAFIENLRGRGVVRVRP